jgi:2-dehydro-3-deoxy-D-gluconate 5-dehydrogenase
MQNNLFSTEGKVAIVTGASRGLGMQMAIGLAQSGADIVAVDIADCSDTVTEVKKLNREAIEVKADVSDQAAVDNIVEQTLAKFGKIDILVNNAGILRSGNAEDLSKEDWESVVKVNLTGQFFCAQAIGKQMLKQESGNIINVSSIAGIAGYAGSVPYSATKAGLIMMSKTLAAEWGPKIRVNALCPGVFATDMTDDFLKDEEFMQDIKTKTALKRYAKAEEIIGTVIYLASEASSYMTGHALIIDGGWTSSI